MGSEKPPRLIFIFLGRLVLMENQAQGEKYSGSLKSPSAKVREKGRADHRSLRQEGAEKQAGLASFTDSAFRLGELITGED